MLDSLQALLAPALMQRLTLVVNHVLGAESQATERLKPHAGRVLRLELTSWPRLLPPPPALAFRVTPAGLMEWCPDEAAADLRLSIDAGHPAALALRALSGEMPLVAIEGDAQLAADVDWLTRNLRWDVAADLERLFGPMAAHELHRLGRGLVKGLRAALERAGPVSAR